MITQEERRWFVELVRERFGDRLAEVRWILDTHFQFTLFAPSDVAELLELARSEGVSPWVTVLVAKPSDLSAWEELRHELIRLRGVEPRVLSAYSTPSPGYRRPPVEIGLEAHGVDVARALHEQFGSFVAVTVGFLAFPEPGSGTWAQRLVAPVHHSDRTAVELAEPVSVQSGHTVRSALLVTNLGPDPVTLNTNGALTALVVDAAGNVVGSFAGGQTMPLVRFTAQPGGTVSIPLLIGTASLVPTLGYAVPPGTWAVIAPLWEEAGRRVCTPPVPITITE